MDSKCLCFIHVIKGKVKTSMSNFDKVMKNVVLNVTFSFSGSV